MYFYKKGTGVILNNKKTLKTAAMFGFDARIALAIFASLSIITGAALCIKLYKA